MIARFICLEFRDEAVGVQIAKIQHFQQVNIGHAKAIFKKFQLHMKLILFAILFYVQHLKKPNSKSCIFFFDVHSLLSFAAQLTTHFSKIRYLNRTNYHVDGMLV